MKDFISTQDLTDIDEAEASKVSKINGIPPECEKCGLWNGENCNTCPVINEV